MPLTFLLIWRLGICSFTHRSKQVGVKNFIAFYILLKTILTYCAGLYKLNIEFSGPSPQPITCIAFMEFDGCVTINQKSQISKSYTQWCITLQVLVMVTFFINFHQRTVHIAIIIILRKKRLKCCNHCMKCNTPKNASKLL